MNNPQAQNGLNGANGVGPVGEEGRPLPGGVVAVIRPQVRVADAVDEDAHKHHGKAPTPQQVPWARLSTMLPLKRYTSHYSCNRSI